MVNLALEDKEAFCEKVLGMKLDNWQREVLLENQKNIVIRSGRQVGKSTVVALKAFFYAMENENKTVLVVAASQRQSGLLFEKIKSFFIEFFPTYIKEEPTLTKLILNNGSRVYSLPAGKTGYAIRGYSIDLLIADEAAFISEAVWVALIPMLAVTRGKIIMLSTPFGKGGYFYHAFGDSDFKQFHVSSENCPRIPKDFLRKEKERLSKLEYAQEYLGEFVEEYTQLFSTELINNCMTILDWNYKKDFNKKKPYYMGVDVARYGGDENAFSIVEYQPDGTIHLVKVITTSRISTTDTIGRIKELDKLFGFRKIFIDDAGVGGGVLDVLIEDLGRKVIGLNNASKSVNIEKTKHHKILKEDLYSNLIILMEQNKIKFINLPEIKRSLKSVQYEYTAERNIRIYGNYTHIAESLTRAAWSIREKGLKIFIA